MKGPPSPIKSARAAAWLSGFVAILVYASSVGNDFAYDDVHIVLENEGIHTLAGLPKAVVSPWWPDAGRTIGLWRPDRRRLHRLS